MGILGHFLPQNSPKEGAPLLEPLWHSARFACPATRISPQRILPQKGAPFPGPLFKIEKIRCPGMLNFTNSRRIRRPLPDTQISQSAREAQKTAPLVWEKSSLEKSNPNPPFWSLRRHVRSVNELNDPLITSGDPFWCLEALLARRCQQESILLASVSAQRGQLHGALSNSLCPDRGRRIRRK